MTDGVKSSAPHLRKPDVAAIIWMPDRPNAWLETLLNISNLEGVVRIYVCLGEPNRDIENLLSGFDVIYKSGVQLSAAISAVIAAEHDHLLIVTSPVIASPDALVVASAWLEHDPRIGTVSFLSNCAGYLSFPHRNTETPVGVDGYNEITLTRQLRARGPVTGPVPVSTPDGAMVLVGRSALVVSGGFSAELDTNPQMAVAEFGIRASRRGFNNFLDTSTFIFRPWDGPHHKSSVLADPGVRHRLFLLHHYFPGLHDIEMQSATSTLAHALDLARAKATGLRILIDGSVLGPQEMGTQLLIIALSLALARQPDVRWIGVAVPDPDNLPAYVHVLKANSKIQVLRAGDLDFPDAPDVDIIHRPFQPTGPIPWERWRGLAKRTIITIQDLIAYRNGSYFRNWEDWAAYRDNLRFQVSQASAIVSISHDVVGPIVEECLPVSRDYIFVVENGIDFRSSNEGVRIPDILVQRGLASASFLVVLGASYAHKNRDFAIKIWLKLRKRGHKLTLVLVGANVPYGSTRSEEAVLLRNSKSDVVLLPDVNGEERNWLLRHTSLALYTTAAEGFGQIPFEAAQFDRPSLFVSFGPLRELIDDTESPETFDFNALVLRAEQLIADPAAAARQIALIKKQVATLSWDQTAKKSIDAYFEVLGRAIR